MIIINKTTANQMIEENNSLKLMNDVLNRTYLMGMGAEILVLEDDSELIDKLQANLTLKNVN
jgi:hypothetical protein